MLTSKGKVFILVFAFSLFIAWYTQARLTYYICALLFSILSVSFVLFRLCLLNVECQRKAPPYAYVGDILEITVTLINKGNFQEEFIDFSDRFLPETTGPEKCTFIERFSPNEKLEFTYKGTCLERGVYTLGPCVLAKHDFFGFFKKEKRMYPESKLIVFPRVFKVGFFPLGLRSSNPRYGTMVLRKAGDYEEFYGIREYSREDGLRKIHWPTSARQGKLMVRHFEQSSSYLGSIILNLKESDNIGMVEDTTLEYAARIAASLTEYLISKGGMVQMLAYSDRPILSGFGKSRDHYMHILEILAELKAHSQSDFSASLASLEPLIPPSSSLTTFVLDKDIESQGLLRSLAVKKDLFITEMVMLSDSFISLSRAKDKAGLSYDTAGVIRYNIQYQAPLSEVFNQEPILNEYQPV